MLGPSAKLFRVKLPIIQSFWVQLDLAIDKLNIVFGFFTVRGICVQLPAQGLIYVTFQTGEFQISCNYVAYSIL